MAGAPAEGTGSNVVEPTPRELVLVVVGQFALMGFGALLAVLIAQTFGKTRSTDAFFAAYGLYSIGLVIASSLRLSAVPALVEDSGARNVTRMFGAVLVMALVLAIPAVLLASPFAQVLIAEDPAGVAPTALRWLWVALATQLVSAVALAVLAVHGAYRAVALVTGTGGVVGVVVFVLFHGRYGIDAASAGLAIAGIYMATLGIALMLRRGLRFARPGRSDFVDFLAQAARLAWASLAFFGPAFAYVVAIAVTTRAGKGEATMLSYAYVLGGVLVTATTYVAASVRSPSINADEDRETAAFDAALAAVRATIAFVGPAIFVIVIAGTPAVQVVLGDGFRRDDAEHIIWLLVALIGWNLGTALGVFAIVELLARKAFQRLATLAVVLVSTTAVGAVLVQRSGGDSVGIAIVLSVSGLLAALLQVASAFPQRWPVLIGELVVWLGRELVVLAVAAVPITLGHLLDVSDGAHAVLIGVSIAAVTAGSAIAWPLERGALRALIS